MALVHQATLTPSKLELLGEWLPSRPWFRNGGELTRLGSYRFDDPAGEVGIEIMLVESGSVLFQIPLAYRAAELPGADHYLLGTMQHSVLGQRWIYDGCGDPVIVRALATAILTGGSEAMVEVEVDGKMTSMPSSVSVRGSGQGTNPVPGFDAITGHDSGTVTRVVTNAFRLDVARVIESNLEAPFVLTATWEGRSNVATMGLTLT